MLITTFASVATFAAAVLLHALSRHGHWRIEQHRAPAWLAVALLGVLALAAWVAACGPGAGFSAMLAGSMVALVAQPWLATRLRRARRT